MSTTPWRQHAHTRLPALLSVLSILLVALLHPAPAGAAADESPRHRVQDQSRRAPCAAPISQAGPATASSTTALTVVTATVTPAEAGRRIVLERRTGHGWRPKATITTNADGRGEFFVPTPSHGRGTYRVVAQSYRGLLAKRSTAVVSDTWGAARLRRRVRRHQPGPRLGAPDPVLQPVGRAGLLEGLTRGRQRRRRRPPPRLDAGPDGDRDVHGHRQGRQRHRARTPTV